MICLVGKVKNNSNFYVHFFIIGWHSNSMRAFNLNKNVFQRDFEWGGGQKVFLEDIYPNGYAELDCKISYIVFYIITFWPVNYP